MPGNPVDRFVSPGGRKVVKRLRSGTEPMVSGMLTRRSEDGRGGSRIICASDEKKNTDGVKYTYNETLNFNDKHSP